MPAATTPTGSAGLQESLWGPRADDWATRQESVMHAAFEACFDAVGVAAGTRLLDAGCGSGLALRLAADRGAEVAGLDATEALLAHARRRVPGAPLVHGDLEALPFEAASFDVVTGFNSFQYATRPRAAVAEALRVTRPGGQVLALVWGPADMCELGPYIAALGAHMPPPPPGAPGPFALSGESALAELLTSAGLADVVIADVRIEWAYPDMETAVRALSSSGPAYKAIQHAGEAAVGASIAQVLEPYREGRAISVHNTWRYAIGRRP